MYVLSATVQSLEHNIQNLILYREFIRQACREYREKISDERTSFIRYDYSIDNPLGRKITSSFNFKRES